MIFRKTVVRILALVIVLALLPGCAKYWQVQSSFNEAARAETRAALGDVDSYMGGEAANNIYGGIEETLTNTYIEGLPEKLRVNAYMIRSMCQWRLGKTEAALASVQKGKEQTYFIKYPRDAVLLSMVPALSYDEEVSRHYLANGKKVSLKEYGMNEDLTFIANSGYRKNYREAMRSFETALQVENAPPAILDYLHYQKWSVLRNWNTVIHKIIIGEGESDDEINASYDAQDAALKDVRENSLGQSLADAITAERSAVPKTSYLRMLMPESSQGMTLSPRVEGMAGVK